MRNLHTQSRTQKGATLIVALVFLLVLTIAGVTAMRFSTFEERMASNSQFRNQVFQQAQNELRAQLLAFNTNLANRAPLLLAINQPAETSANLTALPMLPKTSRLAQAVTPITGTLAASNTVRYTQEKPCDDGSSVERFICIDFEMNARAELESGTYSWQSQGITFQNNK
ncbi:PilX N-terminal domain-containing pilus assembly protein [Pseudomonas sp. TMP9]|uniref:pilus assembly PilX family protein n=1 Tax=Pseudomonas sp. TMP9 TaxID=3133144 RepID=UPI0030D0FAD3